LDALEDLIIKIDTDDAGRSDADVTIIFLGDLVDRGPSSREVVECAMALRSRRSDVRFIMGNHEEVFLAALDGQQGAMRLLIRIGGQSTLNSYGISGDEYLAASYEDLVGLAQERVPAEHRQFMAGFEDQIMIGDYLFVHAGIRPGVPTQQQVPSDLRWIRDGFLDYAGDHGCVVVHGHTVTERAQDRANRIGIDTGAFASGRLTALGLEGRQRWFLCGVA